jgi:hypothetical protein
MNKSDRSQSRKVNTTKELTDLPIKPEKMKLMKKYTRKTKNHIGHIKMRECSKCTGKRLRALKNQKAPSLSKLQKDGYLKVRLTTLIKNKEFMSKKINWRIKLKLSIKREKWKKY